MVLLCFSCSTPCKSAKGLENHLKSRPGCLADLGILPSANWSKTLGLSTSNTSSNPAINEHTFPVEPDPIRAAKRPVPVMWGDKNDDNFPSSCLSPDSPQKALKKGSVASVRGVHNATLTIEHRCGSKQIQMTLDEDAVLGLLKNKGIVGVEDTHSLSRAQIQRIQNMLDPNNEEINDDHDPDELEDDWDIPEIETHEGAPVNGPNVLEDGEDLLFHDAKMYADRMHGCFTNEEILSIHLLGIMREIGAPLKTYGRIVSLFKDVITEGDPITSTFRHRHSAINHFMHRFSMKGLYPTILTQPSPMNNRFYPVPVHNAQTMIESLLYSSLAMDDNNLLFPNPDDPLAPPPTEVTTIADIDTGRVYRNAYNNLCNRPNHILCGIIAYIDKLATDRHGHLSLEPVYFTLSIFKQKTRNRPEAWRPLGYIPNIGLMSKAESAHAMKSSDKVQLYHDILTKIFQPLAELQSKGGLPYELHYRGKVYNVFLQFPLLTVLGDTESHDRLCGRYNSRGLGVARLCRHCTTPREQTDNVDYEWEHILPADVQIHIDANDKEALRSISQHPIRNAFYLGICLGGNLRGIHGMTPGEPLHVLELGLFKIVIEGFFVNIGYNPWSKSYPKILQQVDVWARRIGKALGHQSDRNLPRTYFPNGVTGGTKLAGHEMNGVILVLLILCKLTESRTLLLTSKYIDQHQIRGWIKLFESLLVWRWWLKLPSIALAEIQASEHATHALLKLFKSVVKREHGSKLLIIKFHLCLHFLENQLDYGVTANVDTGPMESNHKCNAKKPSVQTQRRAETIELQTSRRYIENLILDTAAATLERTHPQVVVDKQVVPVLSGAKFTIAWASSNGDDNDIKSHATIVWDKSNCIVTSYHPRYLQWLCINILAELGPNDSIRGCTEHKRSTQSGDKYIFRAHPAWRGGESWHDWAVFSWEDDDGMSLRIPAQIITFIEFDGADMRMLQDLPYVFGETPGLYAMVESLERPLMDAKTGSRVVVASTKALSKHAIQQHQRNGMPLNAPNLCLVSIDTIYEPIAAIPHDGGLIGDFLFIRPADNWGYGFTQMIEDKEPDQGIGSDTERSDTDSSVTDSSDTDSSV
jgi:hypothetical protein